MECQGHDSIKSRSLSNAQQVNDANEQLFVAVPHNKQTSVVGFEAMSGLPSGGASLPQQTAYLDRTYLSLETLSNESFWIQHPAYNPFLQLQLDVKNKPFTIVSELEGVNANADGKDDRYPEYRLHKFREPGGERQIVVMLWDRFSQEPSIPFPLSQCELDFLRVNGAGKSRLGEFAEYYFYVERQKQFDKDSPNAYLVTKVLSDRLCLPEGKPTTLTKVEWHCLGIDPNYGISKIPDFIDSRFDYVVVSDLYIVVRTRDSLGICPYRSGRNFCKIKFREKIRKVFQVFISENAPAVVVSDIKTNKIQVIAITDYQSHLKPIGTVSKKCISLDMPDFEDSKVVFHLDPNKADVERLCAATLLGIERLKLLEKLSELGKNKNCLASFTKHIQNMYDFDYRNTNDYYKTLQQLTKKGGVALEGEANLKKIAQQLFRLTQLTLENNKNPKPGNSKDTNYPLSNRRLTSSGSVKMWVLTIPRDTNDYLQGDDDLQREVRQSMVNYWLNQIKLFQGSGSLDLDTRGQVDAIIRDLCETRLDPQTVVIPGKNAAEQGYLVDRDSIAYRVLSQILQERALEKFSRKEVVFNDWEHQAQRSFLKMYLHELQIKVATQTSPIEKVVKVELFRNPSNIIVKNTNRNNNNNNS